MTRSPETTPQPRLPEGRSPLITAGALGAVALLGAIAGAAVWLITDLVSRSDIGGPGMTLRGNGALIVPCFGGPALLGLGWGLLALARARRLLTTGATTAASLALPVALIAGFQVANLAVPRLVNAASPARSGHTATLLPSGQILVAGGSGPYAPHDTAELYDPATGRWTATGSLARPRAGH